MIVESNVILSISTSQQVTQTTPSLLNSSPGRPPPLQSSFPELSQNAAGAVECECSLNALSAPPSSYGANGGSSARPGSFFGSRLGEDSGAGLEADDGGGATTSATTSAGFVWPLCVDIGLPEDSFNLRGPPEERQGFWDEDGLPMEKSCCYDADDIMAEDNQRAEKYIVTIPFSVLLSIYQSLDADKGWEKLAAEAGYTFDKIRLLELEGARSQGSPSRSLLWELGSRNTTVRQLYSRLSNLGRYREMKILEDYVHSPSSSPFVDNGLKGLPDVPQDSSNSLKGLTSPFSKKNNNSNSNNSSIQSNSVNFNQHMSDVNISMKCQQADKCYPGKEMPSLSPSSSNSEINRMNPPPSNPTGIAAPTLKPTNPGGQGNNNVNLLQNMMKQIPGGASNSGSSSSSSSSSGQGLSKYQTSPSASSPSSSSSPLSDGQFSSSVSSLPGLENTFEEHVALMGSARYSYAEVLQATNGFSERNKLGEGAFGKVYFGVLRQNKCAVKKLSEAENQESVVERSTQIKRELTSLLKFRHENIVMLYGYAVEGECLCLIYQYMPNGSLEDRLMCKKNTPPLVWSQRLNIMVGACQGLNFLHTMREQPLIHGDIKSANILLDKYMEAKIGDLGQAQQASGREVGSTSTSRLTHITRAQASTKLYGTRAYQPGEVQTGSQPSTKSDVFAMGVVLLEVFSGEKAYDERREGEQFLADYFRSLKMESGDDACVNKLDRRGGDFPRDVCLAILDLADKATSHLKRKRPNSSQMLQKMTEVEELYTQRTGIKHTGMDSLPGSEHSCHMSHSSSPGASVPNLTGAPPQHKPPQPSQGVPSMPGKPSNDFSINVDKGQPTEKHYAMHMAHEKPNNCVMPSLICEAASSPSNHSSLTSSSGRSPIDYFQTGQPLPPAFRLQQAYDIQSEAERKRISRISQCQATKQIASQAEGAEAEVLPQADQAKLAALEQFDRENMHRGEEEKESNSFQSDPKKLAALKQFDQQVHRVHVQEEVFQTQHQALSQDSSLASDPKKLAQLRLFDEANVNPVNSHPGQQEEREVLASDPRKLAALTQFDAANCHTGTASTLPSAAAVPYRLAAGTQSSTGSSAPALSSMAGQPQSMKPVDTRQDSSTHDPFPVSQLDYVVSSQKEALDSYLSTGSHQQVVTPQVYPFSAPGVNGSAMAAVSASDTPQTGLTHVTSGACEGHAPPQLPSSNFVSSDGPVLSSNFTTSDEALLRRQKNFFDMYSKALEGEIDDGDEDDDDFEDANAGLENGYVEENDNTTYVTSALPVHSGTPGEAYSSPVQEQVSMGRVDGHCHPVPSEQDESVLNYFKQKQQHYGKTFNKSQVSQC